MVKTTHLRYNYGESDYKCAGGHAGCYQAQPSSTVMSLMMVLTCIVYFLYPGQKDIAIIDMHLEMMKKAQIYSQLLSFIIKFLWEWSRSFIVAIFMALSCVITSHLLHVSGWTAIIFMAFSQDCTYWWIAIFFVTAFSQVWLEGNNFYGFFAGLIPAIDFISFPLIKCCTYF